MPLFTATSTPQRLPRVLRCPTQLLVQVKQAGTVVLTRDQGQSQAAAKGSGDGVELTNANTNGAQPPTNFFWQGEVWYVALGVNPSINVIIEILGEEGVS